MFWFICGLSLTYQFQCLLFFLILYLLIRQQNHTRIQMMLEFLFLSSSSLFPLPLCLCFFHLRFHWLNFSFPVDLCVWVCDKMLNEGAWKSSDLDLSTNLLLLRGVSLPFFDILYEHSMDVWFGGWTDMWGIMGRFGEQ